MSALLSADLFKGQLIRLAAPQPDDKEIIARWHNDAEYLRHLDSAPARPRPASYFDAGIDKSKDEHEFGFAIRTLADDKLIGYTELEVYWSHQVAWISIGIGERDYRGKGFGTEALRLTVAYAFRELNLYRLSLSVFSYNPRAVHLYEKLGFVHEGVMRSALYRDGQRHDMLIMGLLRPEWERSQVDGG